MIAIVDYGMGNLNSVIKAFKRVGHDSYLASKPGDLARASKIVLPGVGHFKMGMDNLKASGMDEEIRKKVLNDKLPILGICLGMQLLLGSSEEGGSKGLSLIDGRVLKFPDTLDKKIPHMGWNNISIKKQSRCFHELDENCEFYFVHSFYVECNEELISAKTYYGIEFVSGIEKNNIFGTQFHPEKSHSAGLKIIENFANI